MITQFFLLSVLPLALSSPEVKSLYELEIQNLTKSCKKIACPSIEEPMCVKMKRNDAKYNNQTTYVYMINKCEMEYMKCYKNLGIESAVVPMKYCEHNTKTRRGNRKIKRDVASDSNDKDCPTQCSTNDVMVCGKCSHSIYRTFLSICHMRMFFCTKHEKLELVSRLPCAMLAPYFISGNTGDNEHRQESGDDNIVMKYIICKEKEKLESTGKEDSKCNFD